MGLKEILKKCAYLLPDKLYLSLRYYMTFHRFPNWEAPQTYNEKLQWLKLHDHHPRYHRMADKAAVKDYVREVLGADYGIPTLGLWDRVEDIDWEALPRRFVLKCTHDSGSVVLCPDKGKLDREAAISLLSRGLATDYYREYREWPYQDARRQIIAEEYLQDDQGNPPDDYKVMCFGGQPKLVILHQGRFGEHTMDFYDTDWNLLPITRVGQNRSTEPAPRPRLLEEMLRLSAILSEGMPHLRVDWYEMNGRLYLGELTFYNASGFGPFADPEDDRRIGSWIPLELAHSMDN